MALGYTGSAGSTNILTSGKEKDYEDDEVRYGYSTTVEKVNKSPSRHKKAKD